MSFMRDFFGSVVDGIVSGAANQARSGNGSQRGRIERLCRELGWSVDERDGDSIRLHFNSADGYVRKVRISGGDIVGFFAHSDAVFPVRSVPPNIMAYLLRRNLEDSGAGMWGMIVNEDDDATFHVSYMALGDGLDAGMLKSICESLVNEAADFDSRLRRAGLLD